MPICIFNKDADHRYRCEYEVRPNSIKVDVEYDIGKELETEDGIRILSSKVEFDDRDILIVDSESKASYLLKKASYAGMSSRYGTFDRKEITSFVSNTFFKDSSHEKLMKLYPTPKIKRVRLYSPLIAGYLRYPSVQIINTTESHSFVLSKKSKDKEILIGINNIKRVSIADEWNSEYSQSTITIELSAFVEIEFRRRVDYTDVYEYIYEMMIYMQLFCPGIFTIDKIVAEVEGESYELSVPLHYPEYRDQRYYSTKTGLLDFLKICYLQIPYRRGSNDIRNIPYIVMNTYRSIEDNFLMLYRFVECFYKRCGITKRFITQCFNEHLQNRQELSDNQIKHYAQEIISLRNHYVHSGYFIKNGCLKINFGKDEKELQDYTANVDVNWIYERTRLLYAMVIDIIFKDMLGIEEYDYRGNYVLC